MSGYIAQRDPLAILLANRFHLSPFRAAFVGCVIYSVLVYGLGVLLSLTYAGPDVGGIYEGAETVVSPVVFILIPPVLWWFYLWQPAAITAAIEAQDRSRTMEPSEKCPQPASTTYANVIFNRSLWAILSAVTAIGVVVGWYFLVVLPNIPDQGFMAWWYVLPAYRFGIFLPLVGVFLYMLLMIITRQLCAILILNKFFSQGQTIRVRPLHPDGAGGLGAVGKLAIATAWFGVGMGFWATVYSLLLTHAFTTQGLVLAILYWALYLILTPILLLGPVWGAHQAMRRAKMDQLAEISRMVDKYFASSQILKEDRVQEYNRHLKALWKRYQFIQKNYPEWPFSTSFFRNFGIAAVLPLISGLISLLKDVL
jgi:hypothetical protein